MNRLLRQERQLKGSDMYVNEQEKMLTLPEEEARFLRKQNKIQSTRTANCEVFIKLNVSPEDAKVLVIRERTGPEPVMTAAVNGCLPDLRTAQ